VSEQQYSRVLKTLAAALKRRRRELGWTQEDVAEALSLVPRQYQKIEAGEVNVTLRSLVRIAAALGVRARDLL
jgi:transcriptional regulator with XRE-family HTH domain